MRILGVDPGSQRTGYGCIETEGSRYHVVDCGAIAVPARIPLAEKLLVLHRGLAGLLTRHRPDTVAIEDLFYARNARSALVLGHVRGALMLAAAEAGVTICEYTAAEVKAGGGGLRPRRETAGAADGGAAAGDGAAPHAAGRLRRAGGGRVPRALERRGAPTPGHGPRRAQLAPPCPPRQRIGDERRGASGPHKRGAKRGAGVPARVNDWIPARPPRRQAAEPHRRRRPRRRVRAPGAALDLLRPRRNRRGGVAARAHARPRGHAGPVRLRLGCSSSSSSST